jgi:hypothetical protein
MKSLYQYGLQNPGSNYWMGGDQRPTETGPGPRLGQISQISQISQLGVGFDSLPDLITAGAQAFGGYENAQAAEDARKAAEITAATAAANAKTAAANSAALAKGQIMGMEPTTFYTVAAVGLGAVVLAVVFFNKQPA